MKVSLDGGRTYADVTQGVRVIYGDVDVPGEVEPSGEVRVNLTDEGIVVDVWSSREAPGALDHNIGTRAEMLGDLVSRLVEAGA